MNTLSGDVSTILASTGWNLTTIPYSPPAGKNLGVYTVHSQSSYLKGLSVLYRFGDGFIVTYYKENSQVQNNQSQINIRYTLMDG